MFLGIVMSIVAFFKIKCYTTSNFLVDNCTSTSSGPKLFVPVVQDKGTSSYVATEVIPDPY